VSLLPVPATTGTVTASATARNSSSFSSSVSTGPSPVVPATTRPSLPWSVSQRASVTAAATSSAPSSENGVTMAVATVPKCAIRL
jgi:hypothetical protein